MRIREAKHSELGNLAFIGARAFYEDDIYAHFYPQRRLYPEAFYEGILNSLLDIFTQPGAKVFVAELEDSDFLPPSKSTIAGQKIIGYVTVIFHGDPDQKVQFDAGNEEKGESWRLQAALCWLILFSFLRMVEALIYYMEN